MGMFSKTKQVFKFLFSFWTVGDMVSDIITTMDYKDQCTPKSSSSDPIFGSNLTNGNTIYTNASDGFNSNISHTIPTNVTAGFKATNGDLISCFYWQSGVVFILLPTVMSTLYNLYLVTYGIEKDQPKAIKIINTLFFGVFYMIFTPYLTIFNTGSLLCGSVESYEEDIVGDLATVYKFFEVFFEALPQTIISAVFLSNNGGFASNPIQATSIVFSGMGVIYGSIQGFIACKNHSMVESLDLDFDDGSRQAPRFGIAASTCQIWYWYCLPKKNRF